MTTETAMSEFNDMLESGDIQAFYGFQDEGYPNGWYWMINAAVYGPFEKRDEADAHKLLWAMDPLNNPSIWVGSSPYDAEKNAVLEWEVQKRFPPGRAPRTPHNSSPACDRKR